MLKWSSKTIIIIAIFGIIGLSILGLYTKPLYIIYAFRFHWLFLALAIIFICSPFSGITLDFNTSPQYRFPRWIAQIMLFEASLYAIFLGLTRIYGQLFPVLTSSDPRIVPQTTTWLLWNNGLFPWGWILLFIVFLSYLYNKKAKEKPNQSNNMTTSTIRVATTLSLVLIVICFIFQLCYLLISFNPWMIVYGMRWVTLITLLIMFSLVANRWFKRLVKEIIKWCSPGVTLLIVSTLFAIIIVGISTLMIGSVQSSLLIPTFLKMLQQQEWLNLWYIFIGSWWVLVASMVGLFILQISSGYKIRTVMIATLIFPLLLSFFIWINSANHLISYSTFESSANLIGISGPIIFIMLALSKKRFSMLMQGDISLLGVELTSYNQTIKRVIHAIFSFLYLSLLSGIFLILFVLFSVAILFFVLILPLILVSIFFYIKNYFK